MDGRTDGRTNRRTDRPSYRDARTQLKNHEKKNSPMLMTGRVVNRKSSCYGNMQIDLEKQCTLGLCGEFPEGFYGYLSFELRLPHSKVIRQIFAGRREIQAHTHTNTYT